MADHRLKLIKVLADEDYQAIDRFCAENHGISALPRLAIFLRQRFDVDLNLDPDIVAGFSRDSSHLPGQAQGVSRPTTERECAAILYACFQGDIPLTLSGGRTNLTGSATPLQGVILSTVNMQSPEIHLNAAERSVVAPVGILLEDLRRQVLEQSDGQLIFPIDPTSRVEATVGGALSCNTSGCTPGAKSSIRSWVAAIRFLLPNGWAIEAPRGAFVSRSGFFILDQAGREQEWPVPRYPRPFIKNAGGPYSAPNGAMDLVDLIVGSEGIFGIISACVLKLIEKPANYLDLFISLPQEAAAIRFLEKTREYFQGDLSHLSAFEYFGINGRRYLMHEDQFFRGDDEVAVYVQEPLNNGTLEERTNVWLELLAAADCPAKPEDILLLDDDQQRALLLEARHSLLAHALEVVQQRGAYTIMTDTVIPPEHFSAFLEFTHGLLNKLGLEYLSYGHLGDCHLHFMIITEQPQIEQAKECYNAIVAKSAELGGVYSGEHGTGKRKRNDFLLYYGAEAVAQIRRTKAAVDPRFLLNRGNVVEPPVAE